MPLKAFKKIWVQKVLHRKKEKHAKKVNTDFK